MRALLPLLVLAGLAAVAAACAGGGDSPPPDTPTPALSATPTPDADALSPTPAAAACPAPSGTAPTPVARTYDAPPEMTIDPEKEYIATVRTVRGDFKIRLLPEVAPVTVNSFVFLAREGFFDGVTFHRVIPGFVAQTGDPTGTGSGGPGYTLPAEFSDIPFERGVVGMARAADPDSGGSQWFVTYADAPHLNGQYTVFGRVIQGMEVVDCLTPRDPSRNPYAAPGDAIISIEIEER